MTTKEAKMYWFSTGAYIRESLADFQYRILTTTDLVFLKVQAD